jgi:hypothetical protein
MLENVHEPTENEQVLNMFSNIDKSDTGPLPDCHVMHMHQHAETGTIYFVDVFKIDKKVWDTRVI